MIFSRRGPEGSRAQSVRFDSPVSAFFSRSLFARPVLDDLDDARHVLLCAALKDAVLQHQPYRLAHPHRNAEFFTLRDGEIDVLHEYLDGCAKVEGAWQDGFGEDVHRRKIAAGPIVEDLQHSVVRN